MEIKYSKSYSDHIFFRRYQPLGTEIYTLHARKQRHKGKRWFSYRLINSLGVKYKNNYGKRRQQILQTLLYALNPYISKYVRILSGREQFIRYGNKTRQFGHIQLTKDTLMFHALFFNNNWAALTYDRLCLIRRLFWHIYKNDSPDDIRNDLVVLILELLKDYRQIRGVPFFAYFTRMFKFRLYALIRQKVQSDITLQTRLAKILDEYPEEKITFCSLVREIDLKVLEQYNVGLEQEEEQESLFKWVLYGNSVSKRLKRSKRFLHYYLALQGHSTRDINKYINMKRVRLLERLSDELSNFIFHSGVPRALHIYELRNARRTNC